MADQRAPVSVPCIRSQRGGHDYGCMIAAIMHRFVEYYSVLYSPILPYDMREWTAFSVVFPSLVWRHMIVWLDQDITLKEIEAAILSFPPKQIPGPGWVPRWSGIDNTLTH